MKRGKEAVRAKKALSQNWLVDKNIARKLVAALGSTSETTILEIGPGMGALTSLMLDGPAAVIAIERDEACVRWLRDTYRDVNGFELIQADVLTQDLAALPLSAQTVCISNLPYGLTSPILFHLMASRVPFSRLVLTMQKEVAQRILATPGNKTFGRLTVMTAVYGTVRKLFDLPPTVFHPRPSVTSTAIVIEPQPAEWLNATAWSVLERFVRAAFSARRKTIANCIAHAYSLPTSQVKQTFIDAGFDPRRRAECFAPADFVALSALFSTDLC